MKHILDIIDKAAEDHGLEWCLGFPDHLKKSGANGDWQKEGYTLHHRLAPGNESIIEAKTPSGEIAGFYNISPGNHNLYVSNAETYPDHQRKGLATAAYQLAEKIHKKRITPEHLQTRDAEALWNQPNRPFGNTLKKSEEKPKEELGGGNGTNTGTTGNSGADGAGDRGGNPGRSGLYDHVGMAQAGNWEGAFNHVQKNPKDVLAMLAGTDNPIPPEHMNKYIDIAKRNNDPNALFQLAHNLHPDASMEQLRKLANAAPDDYLIREKVRNHSNFKDIPEMDSKIAPHLFWHSYEKKVDPRHFAVVAHALDQHKYLDSDTHRGAIGVDEYPTHMTLNDSGDNGSYKWSKGTGESKSKLSLNPGHSTVSMDQVIPHLESHAKDHQNALMHSYYNGNDRDLDVKYFSGKPYVKLYRGINGDYAHKVDQAFSHGASSSTFGSAPFSSWTHSPDMAARFAVSRGDIGGDKPMVIAQYHPVENILHTGFHRTDALLDNAHDGEDEIVVKHPDLKHKIRKTDIHVADPGAYGFEDFRKK